MDILSFNPVLGKELLASARRSRSRRTTNIAILVAAACAYWFVLRGALNSGSQDVWQVTAALQFALVTLVAPALAARAITQEREQQTWELLLFTPIPALQIVLGKLSVSCIALARMLAVTLPLVILAFLLHLYAGTEVLSAGTELREFFWSIAATAITASLFLTVGMAISSYSKRSSHSLALSYSFSIGVLVVCTYVEAVLALVVYRDARHPILEPFEANPVIWLNPWYLYYVGVSSRISPLEWMALLCGAFAYITAAVMFTWASVRSILRARGAV
ncbi:MAG TPA: ABC transporter permease subunit [Chthonomonadales bacterium]|nr:ABC transporter permease subunit [Chthonomonadales bacterium]